MIAVVGHTDLTEDAHGVVRAALRTRLAQAPAGTGALVRAGRGLPQVYGRAAREAGRPLTVVLPAEGAVPAPLPAADRAAAGELLLLAEQVRLLPYDPAVRDTVVAADERLVGAARTLLAVWDGSPSDGSDATAHLVAYARARSVPVEVVWPAGAARSGRAERAPGVRRGRPAAGPVGRRPGTYGPGGRDLRP
ncbi:MULTISPECIES: hypothetical protein [Streptomyces]|uniref:Uncharacterized protein n=2 Tax=Streptomyces TaxID=1883 RepID=A0A8H9HI72_9ACTN|nr:MULTISPECIES: hypothetical protein [Streptomyces]RPK87105.1 hypothetical protein EES47_18600 [Streptomyces sp. ADI98-12]WSU35181.1 hypothetical protein OG378_04850 [Streptomyces gougerotii]SUP59854.1 Uncharacterised protein [Streptomyces griseus]GFH68255.1 hypothetical protein Srut_47690 [Streptomyces rutgersensis]GFH78886.1 hypothetical protein Sgou_35560 [Streptomyces gougerotii]